jgi:hypothetical protein
MLALIILISGTAVIMCVICRLSLVSFKAHNPLVILCYIGMAGWAAARGLETLAGGTHTLTDAAGLTVVAVYLLTDMRRWKSGIPRSMFRRHSDSLPF